MNEIQTHNIVMDLTDLTGFIIFLSEHKLSCPVCLNMHKSIFVDKFDGHYYTAAADICLGCGDRNTLIEIDAVTEWKIQNWIKEHGHCR